MELDQDIISQMKQETDIGANTATYVAAEKNPDQHAKIMTLAEQFGASSDYAEQAYEDLRKERERIDVANKINANVPKLKNFISNPDYAAVSKDDLDILKRIELDVDGHSKLDQARTGFMYGLSKAFSGFNKVPGYLGNLSLLPENIYAQSQGKDPIQFKIENENSKYWDQEAEFYRSQNPTLQKEIGEELLSGSVERAADALVIHSMAQIPQLATIIGSSIGGFGLGGLLYTGASTAAEKSDELQKQGVGTVKGTSVGTLNGALEFVFEKIGTSKVFKSWQEAITKEFGKQTAKEFSKNFAKKMVSTYAIGATEEGLTQWSQDFVDYATGISPDMKGAGMRAFGAAALGGFMETTMTAPSGVMAGYAEYLQSEQSKTNKNFFMALGEKTNESKLKERLPGKYREYVEHLTKDGPVENVYISPEIFTEYFQSKKVDPGLMASELGIKDEFDRAVETGSDLKIPTAAMAEKLAGTEHYAGLANDVKFGPDQLSVNEEASQRKDAEDMIKEQYEAAKADKTPDEIKLYEDSAKQVFEDIKRQRIETGRPKKAAAYEATMWSQVLLTQGLNSKQMPFDLYKKYGLKIQNVDETQNGETTDTTEYFQSSPQSKKLGIKFSAVKVNNKITVNPLDTVSVTAELVDSEAGKTAVVDSLRTDKKYPGVSLDAIKSLEYAAARNGATSMSISANRLGIKVSDKLIQQYTDAGFTPSVSGGDAIFVKKLDPVVTYNQATISPLGFYSKLVDTIEKKMANTQDVKSLQAMLSDIKPEEMKWLGLDEFLKGKEKVSKAEFMDFLNSNQLQMKEVTLGGDSTKKDAGYYVSMHELGDKVPYPFVVHKPNGTAWMAFETQAEADAKLNEIEIEPNTQYSKYTLPGGKNYREVLITMPPKTSANLKLDGNYRDIEKWDKSERPSFNQERTADVENNPELIKKKKELVKDLKKEYPDDKTASLAKLVDKVMATTFKDVSAESFSMDISPELIEKFNELKKLYNKLKYPFPKETVYKIRNPFDIGNFVIYNNNREDGGFYTGDQIGKQKFFKTFDDAVDYLEEKSNKTAEQTRKDTYKSSHFDEQNILAHTRLNDRVDSEGKKVLFIEEIQSDWHQAGRKNGYKENNETIVTLIEKRSALTDEFNDFVLEKNIKNYDGDRYKIDDLTRDIKDAKKIIDAYSKSDSDGDMLALEFNLNKAEAEKILSVPQKLVDLAKQHDDVWSREKAITRLVPDAPFKKTWHEMTFRRILRMAAEGGYDRVAWTTGDQQNERYKLSKFVSEIAYHEKSNRLQALDKNQNTVLDQVVPLAQLDEYIGKEAAQKIQEKEVGPEGFRVLENADLELGGSGMKGFYDKILVDYAKKFGKKFDAKVSETEIGTPIQKQAADSWSSISSDVKQPLTEKTKVHSMEISDKLRETALNEGFQLFQEKRGSITFGANRQFNINLFKSKDESTFLHESAHFFLELMGDVAQLENASEKSKQDYQTLLNWFGVNSREEITTEHHEKFARSFETYLYEGKSPSEKLKKAFQAFRQWLISIYKQVPPEQISDEVRAVFDRMLVADQMTEIDQMFGDPKLVMTEDETAAYLEASEKAKTEARDILQAELMQDLIRKKDRAYREKYDQLYAAEMEKAKAMPEFKVIEQITGEQKLSKPVIEKDYAVFKDFLPFKSTKVEGGLHPDFVADLNGFENGQAMLQAIAPYRRGIENYVSSQVVTQMKQEFPELLESPELSDEAIKAAHNKYAKKLKRLEMEFLYRKAQKTIKNVAGKLIRRMPTDMQVRAQAVKIIASTKVTDLKPHLYRAAEKKFAKIAAQEFKKGNYDLAFDAKQKEYLNFELYDAAVDAKQDVEKAVKNFKKIFKKDEDLAKTRDIDLVNAARAILAHFGITKSDKTADAYLKDIKDYDPDTYSVVVALVNSATEKRGNYTTITYDDFSEMKNAVMAIWDLAKDRNEILIDGKVMKKQDAIDALSARSDELSAGKELPGYKKSITDSEKLGIQFLGVLARYRKVEHWARAFDGGVIGAAMKYIFKPVSDAQVQFDLARVEVFKQLETLTPLIKGIDPKKKIDAREINYQFRNKLELLHAILHTGNESNYEKLLIGRQWGSFNEDGTLNDSKFKSMIDRLIADGTLQKSDFDFAQAIWDLNESLKPGAQRAHKKMYGHYFSDITAKPFVNQFGNYRGGYMPAIADKTMVADKAVKEAKDMTEGFNNSFMFPTTGRGFSKSRVDGYFAPLELDLNKIAGHVNQVLKFTHIEPAIKQVAGLVSDKKFAASLFKADPTIAREMLTPWLQRSATQRLAARGMSELGDRFFTALRSRSSLQFMAVNVPNWFQNMTSVFPVMNEVDAKYVMGSVKDYISDRKGFNEAVLLKSDYMKTRAGETVRDVAKDFDQIVLEKTEYDKVKDAARDYAMIGERVSNGIIEMITWNAAYREQIAKGKSESDAVTEADSVVRRTIGDVSPVGSSSVQALTPFGRLFTMMSGYFFNSGNQLLTEWQIAKQMGLSSKAGGRRAMMAFIMIVYAPAVVSAIIMKAFAGKGLDEDDDGEYFDDVFSLLFGQPLRFMTAMLPGGTVANTLINQFNDAPFDDRINISPAASSSESAIRSVVSVPKAVFGEGDPKKALKDGLTTVGLLTGLPASFVGKPLGYLIDVESGKANPSGPIDFTRGIITGKPGGK